ncbi:hypothetical protein, partial [Streptomyces niveus]|uniref:hypothetical protein n=1 Tax=Streptomyces niveus TaxID=193462 RepID=UPI0036A0CF17
APDHEAATTSARPAIEDGPPTGRTRPEQPGQDSGTCPLNPTAKDRSYTRPAAWRRAGRNPSPSGD